MVERRSPLSVLQGGPTGFDHQPVMCIYGCRSEMPFTLYCLSSDLTGKGTLVSPEKPIPIPFPNGHNFNFGAPILSVIIACITWGACATPLIISSAFTTIVVAAAAVVLPSSVMRASSRRSSVRMGMDGNEVGERCLHQILNRCTQVGSTVLFPEG